MHSSVGTISSDSVLTKYGGFAPTRSSQHLIEVLQRMRLSIEGTVPELRARIRDAGGLAAAPPATGPGSSRLLALPPTGAGSSRPLGFPPAGGSKRKPDAAAVGASKPKKGKTLALPAPELNEEPMALPAPKGKKSAPEKPMHTHPIAELPDNCAVCDTYGNPLVSHPLTGRNPIEISKKPAAPREGLLEDADDTTTNLRLTSGAVEPGDEMTQLTQGGLVKPVQVPAADMYEKELKSQLLKMIAEDEANEDDEEEDEELEEEE